MNTCWTKTYTGFESIMGFDEEWIEALHSITPNGEYLGSIKITLEYIPMDNKDTKE